MASLLRITFTGEATGSWSVAFMTDALADGFEELRTEGFFFTGALFMAGFFCAVAGFRDVLFIDRRRGIFREVLVMDRRRGVFLAATGLNFTRDATGIGAMSSLRTHFV